ncbi:MAG: CheY-like chemotaxis protein [Planctomycetota bacterium]|jgi:CheY-like chemotaxis protein
MMILAKIGLEVDLPKTGREGLEAYQSGNYDTILMDCQMPEMDGFEATGCIREHEGSTASPISIIAMTANATREDRARCFDVGMNDDLSKPATTRNLAEVLSR